MFIRQIYIIYYIYYIYYYIIHICVYSVYVCVGVCPFSIIIKITMLEQVLV